MQRKTKIYANVKQYLQNLIFGSVYQGDGFFRNGEIYIAQRLRSHAGSVELIATNLNDEVEFHHSEEVGRLLFRTEKEVLRMPTSLATH